jgi:hypothetical protein
MPQLHETLYGHRFFDGQLPALIRALESIAQSLVAKQNPQNPEVRDTWVAIEGQAGYLHLKDGITLFGCQFHAEAIEVQMHDGTQEVVHPENRESYDAIYHLCAGHGPLETIEIDGKKYVVVITPYND